MQKKHWIHTAAGLLLIQALVLTAHAQDPLPAAAVTTPAVSAASNRTHRSVGNSFGFAGRMGKAVGMTPEQQDTVRGLLAEQRQQHTAIQEQTDAKIRALLNADQQKKFDAFLAQLKQERSARFRRAS